MIPVTPHQPDLGLQLLAWRIDITGGSFLDLTVPSPLNPGDLVMAVIQTAVPASSASSIRFTNQGDYNNSLPTITGSTTSGNYTYGIQIYQDQSGQPASSIVRFSLTSGFLGVPSWLSFYRINNGQRLANYITSASDLSFTAATPGTVTASYTTGNVIVAQPATNYLEVALFGSPANNMLLTSVSDANTGQAYSTQQSNVYSTGASLSASLYSRYKQGVAESVTAGVDNITYNPTNTVSPVSWAVLRFIG